MKGLMNNTTRKKKSSWKTTVGGLLSAAGEAVKIFAPPPFNLIGSGLLMFGLLLTGTSARDNKVTSEDVGAHQ